MFRTYDPPRMLAATDDLTANQFQQLMTWLWKTDQSPTPRVVYTWRQSNNLDTDR